jgi:hypothetical protein
MRRRQYCQRLLGCLDLRLNRLCSPFLLLELTQGSERVEAQSVAAFVAPLVRSRFQSGTQQRQQLSRALVAPSRTAASSRRKTFGWSRNTNAAE